MNSRACAHVGRTLTFGSGDVKISLMEREKGVEESGSHYIVR